MKISIIGTGYVGLVSGVCLAEKGHDVVCVDLDQDKVDRINAGQSPIHEKGLDELLAKCCGVNFRATTDLRSAVLDSEISMIAVGTPFDGDEIDLQYIRAAASQIGNGIKGQAELSCRARQKHRGAGNHQRSRAAAGGASLRQESRTGLRRGHEPRVSPRG